MVPVGERVKAGIVRGGSEKPDYRNLWRVGWIVHRQLFYRRGEKRKYQLQGSRVPLRDCRFVSFDGQIFGLRFVALAHSLSIKYSPLRGCKERSSIWQWVGLQRNENRHVRT